VRRRLDDCWPNAGAGGNSVWNWRAAVGQIPRTFIYLF